MKSARFPIDENETCQLLKADLFFLFVFVLFPFLFSFFSLEPKIAEKLEKNSLVSQENLVPNELTKYRCFTENRSGDASDLDLG